MKIGIVRTDLASSGGAERYTLNLLNQLVQRGHEPHIFTIEAPPQLPPQVIVHRCVLEKEVTSSTRKRRKSSRLARHLAFEKWLGEAVRAADLDVLLTMERVLPSDVFRAGGGVHREWLAICAANAPLWKRWMLRHNAAHREMLRAEAELFRPQNTRMVVCNSHMIADEIVRHYSYPRERVRVVFNGVDLAQFRPASAEHRASLRLAQNLGENDIAALFVGSGFWRKGLDVAIELTASWNRLEKTQGRNVHLFVVGKGKTGSFERQAKRLKIAENVHFAGATSPNRVLDWYQLSDIFLFPTRYDPFANVCLEANACGVPVVTTTRNGFQEQIQNGVNGVVLPGDGISSTRSELEQGAQQVFEFYKARSNAESVRQSVLHLDVETHGANLLNALEKAIAFLFEPTF